MYTVTPRRHRALLYLFAFVISVTSLPALAAKPVPTPSLTSQLQDLVAEGNVIDSDLAAITLSTDNSCTELGTTNTSVTDYLASIETVSAGITAPLTIDADSLTALDDLSALAVNMANSARTLSFDVNSISGAADLVEYQASLAAMLRLADDIGTMADRILEMANKILLMADNIGLMADRILLTQTLQNANVALTQASILSTQQNMVALSDTLSTFGYNNTLTGLITDGNLLSDDMGVVVLNETNMATELAAIETSVSTYLDRVLTLYTQINQDSVMTSFYINGDTLTALGDLSVINAALASALQAYAQNINSLTPLTSTPVLSDATTSMLRLTSDIGLMSDRIIEMADLIIIMADNIGIMSGRIVDTQTLQQTNITLTQNSLLTATAVTVGVIAAAGL